MPLDYKKYDPEWKTKIRPAILGRANHACEECGVKNYSVGYWGNDGKFWTGEECLDLLEKTGYDIFANELSHIPGDLKPIKIVLTVAHLDHNPGNNDYSNLKALCQRHHLAYDKTHHMANSRQTIENKKGLTRLF